MKTYSILFLSFCSLLYGQHVEVQWKGYKTIDIEATKQLKIPNSDNVEVSLYNGIPYVNIKNKETGNVNIKVTNLQWEPVKSDATFDTNTGILPSRDLYDGFSQMNTVDNAFYSYISVAGFKRDKEQILRLKSFDIQKNSLSTKRSSLASNLVGDTTNPLKSGTFYKIKIDKSGVFKITYKFLKDNGIDPSQINPQNFRVYGNGGLMLPENNNDWRYAALQENAIEVVGGEDGKWDDGDYALFYGQGPNGFNLYSSGYGNGNKRSETRIDAPLNYVNLYENYAYYFINFDLGAGKRVQKNDVTPPSNLIFRYDAYQYVNDEKNNLVGVGKIWVGDYFLNPKDITFNTTTPIQNGDLVTLSSRVIGYKAVNGKLTTNLNGNSIVRNIPNPFTSGANDYYPITFSKYTYNNFSGNTINFNFTPDTSANPVGLFYFDYAEALYKQDLVFNGSQLSFRDYAIQENSGDLYGFKISNPSGIDRVWDVSDITNVKSKSNMNTSGDYIFGYQTDVNNNYFNNEFVAFKLSAAYDPSFIGRIQNQDLSGLTNIDYLIITKAEFAGEAQRLADYYKKKNNYNVQIVDINQIYNEYSSGGQDITAIRDFVTRLSAGNTLKYVLILGNGTYDYKDRISPNSNIVPTFQSEASNDYVASYVTDDYYAMTSLQQTNFIGNIIPDIPVGRLPAKDINEAKTLINKTLAYYNELPGQSSPFGDWRMKLNFVVDDDNTTGGSNGTSFHNYMNNSIVSNFEGSTDKPEYNVAKLYMDAYPAVSTSGGPRFPQVTSAINSGVNNSLYLYYFGHGGINGWSQSRVLGITDIQAFNNFNNAYSRFPLVSTITCEFTLWDNPAFVSAGELVLKNKLGGAATMITSSRALAVSYGANFTNTFTKFIFAKNSDEFNPLGDAFLQAKKNYGPSYDHFRVNYLGDPAMKLARPKKLISVDKIETPQGLVTPTSGQIRALDFVKISGKVNKADGTVDTNFNGKITVDIFDKRNTKTTLNNPGYLTPTLTYTEEGSPICRTTGKVVNGIFTVEFYMPKDINYTLGAGRLLLYADNWSKAQDNSYDVYYNSPIPVGGINPNGVNDNTPPKVNLFMNNTNFADGGITNQNPTFLACVTDDTGINSSGSGVGHNITAVLDGQVSSTYVLNEYYLSGESNGCIATSLADYQKGSVSFPFSNLAEGPHQIVFKIWDINNNSTTVTLNFVVKNDANQGLVINKLLNWPNPFTDKTYIQFEHNCDDVLQVNTQIYTITGKLVRNLSTTVSSVPFREGYRTDKTAIEWDGKDDFGDSIGKGTYIYKVFVKSINQDKCKGSTTQVEKMVILK